MRNKKSPGENRGSSPWSWGESNPRSSLTVQILLRAQFPVLPSIRLGTPDYRRFVSSTVWLRHLGQTGILWFLTPAGTEAYSVPHLVPGDGSRTEGVSGLR